MVVAKHKWDWDTASLDDKKLYVTLLRRDHHSDEVIGTFFGKSKGAIVGFRHRELPELTFGKKATKPKVELERFKELLAAAGKVETSERAPEVSEQEAPVVPKTPSAPKPVRKIVAKVSSVPEPVVKVVPKASAPGCRWPTGTGGSLKNPELCRKATDPGENLCPEHKVIARGGR